jgi:hypothetical protein
VKDASLVGTNPAQAEPSAEQVAAMLGLVAASGFEATIKAQEKLLAQLLPALAAREELLGRMAAGALPADLASRRPVGPTSISAAPAAVAPVTVTELQAALRAAWAGEFAAGSMYWSTPAFSPQTGPCWALSGHVVMVVGCHGGAGASTVALAMALAALESGRSVRLLDCASAERSGLLTAVDAELGVEPGWRRGRRARLPIDRVAGVLASAADVPVPPDEPLGPVEVTVIDSGWGAAGVLSGGSWLAQVAEPAAVVLVARATVPALRQLEQAMAMCCQDPVVAINRPTRLDRSVHATSGPLLLAALAAGLVVRVPSNRHLAAHGISSAPLPQGVLKAGRQLLARVLAAHPQATGAQHRSGSLGPTFTKRTVDNDHCLD